MGLLASFKTILGFEDELESRDKPVGQSMQTSMKRMVPTSRAQLQERVVSADFQPQKQAKKTELPQLSGMGIIIVEPRSYESDSRQISAYLKAGHVVVVNLKFLDAPTGKRLIDFICGTIYAFEGFVKKLGGNIFLCTPGSVSVVDNQEDEVVFNEQPIAEVAQPEMEEESAPYYYRSA